MSLPVPGYLQTAGIQDTDLRFTWDDWNSEDAYEPVDEELEERLGRLSQRAALAFSIACAEWIVHRFGRVSNDPIPWLYLESAWAGVVDACYSPYWELEGSAWQGPVRGPLGEAIVLVVDTLQCVEEDDDPEGNAAALSNLVEHVLTDVRPFLAWRDQILPRLERFYPLNSKDTRGEPVPRQALDPDFDFRPEAAPGLIHQFLQGLDPTQNPFLGSPDEMKQLGFQGTPYELP